MGVFEHFPYANIHNLNLDWILEHIKEAQTKFSEAISNAQKESELLKERVNNVINSSKEKILSQIK